MLSSRAADIIKSLRLGDPTGYNADLLQLEGFCSTDVQWERVLKGLPKELASDPTAYENNEFLSTIFLRTQSYARYTWLRQLAADIQAYSQVTFDYFMDNRERLFFFVVSAEPEQLTLLDWIVRVSQWLARHPESQQVEREAKNFQWKSLKQTLDEVKRHPERYTGAFAPLMIGERLRQEFLSLAT